MPSWNIEKARRPEIILAEMIKSSAVGTTGHHLMRALVLAYDARGGQLQNPDGSGQISVRTSTGEQKNYDAAIGPPNPPGSVKARVLTDGIDAILSDADTRVFWPLISSEMALPGEHVLIMFEDSHQENGIWISRVPDHVGQNVAPGVSSYTAPAQSAQNAMDIFIKQPLDYRPDDLSEVPSSDAAGIFFGR